MIQALSPAIRLYVGGMAATVRGLPVEQAGHRNGQRKKIRWSVREGDSAVVETIEAARYLASRRRDLWPRSLVLAAQGVDDVQYAECVAEVLRFADPDDTIGLGGWCILGRRQRLLPVFKRTVEAVAPMIARAGLGAIHIFGVLWEPALVYLLAVADEHQLRVSTDSSKPVISVTWANPRKAGVRSEELTANANVEWWIDHLARLRETSGYARAVREREAGIWRARIQAAPEVEWAAEQGSLFRKAA